MEKTARLPSPKRCNGKINLIPCANHPHFSKFFGELVQDSEVMRHIGKPIKDQRLLEEKVQEHCNNPRAFVVTEENPLEPKGIVAVRQSKEEGYLSIECSCCSQIWEQRLGDIFQISYRIHAQSQGKGICTQATSQLIEWAFREWNLPSLAALIQLENYASIKVARKLGLQLVGTFLYSGNLWEYHKITQAQYLAARGF